jgi:RNA polymerase sigma-70 factor (sigma-E family)
VRFEEYVAEQGQPLLRLAYVLTGDAHLAEDLTQIALTEAYRHWRKVTTARKPDTYVRRILVNAYLSWRRRRSSAERPMDLGPDVGASAPDPADAVAARDQMRRLLSELPVRARTVLVLRYYADLDDAAIAELMGVSEGGVRATASRALARLRDNGVVDATEGTR